MKKFLFLAFAFLLFLQTSNAQEINFQIGHTHDILTVKFSPDDKTLISYSAGDGRLILWDVESGKVIWQRKTSFLQKANERYFLREFNWSADQSKIITKGDNGLFESWDAKTGGILAVSENKPGIELFLADKKAVSISKDYSNIVVSDGAAKQQFKRFGNNSAFDTSNNGEMIAEGGGWGDAAIKITNVKTGKSWFLDGHPSVIGGLAFNPDGKFLAVGGSDKIIYIFDVAKKSVARKFDGNNKPIKSISFSPDGKFLLSLNKDGEMNIWELQSGNLLRGTESIRGISGLNSNEFSKDGKYFLFVNEGNFGVWETKDWKKLKEFKTPEKYESKGGMMTISYDRVPVYSTAFVKDGKEIVASHYDGTLRVWNVNSSKQLKIFSIGEDAEFLAPLENQKILAVFHNNDRNNDKMKIKLLNYENGTKIKQFDDKKTS